MGSGKSKEIIIQVDREDPDFCKKEWKIMKTKKIAHGLYGSIYGACCNAKCNYIAKVTENKTEHARKLFRHEIEVQHVLSQVGIGPKIIVAKLYKDGTGIIIMPRLSLTLKELLSKQGSLTFEQQIDLINVIQNLHKLGYIHKDLHVENIMYDENMQPVIIDYATAGKPIRRPLFVYLCKQDYNKLIASIVKAGFDPTYIKKYAKTECL